MGVLREETRRTLQSLHQHGVLKPVRASALKPNEVCVAIVCADCDEIDDLMRQHGQFQVACQAKRSSLHILGHNGGMLRAAPRSPLVRNGYHHEVYTQVGETTLIKGDPEMVCYVHFECGAAEIAGIDPIDVFLHLFDGADHLHVYVSNMLRAFRTNEPLPAGMDDLKHFYQHQAKAGRLHPRIVQGEVHRPRTFVQINWGDGRGRRSYYASRSALAAWMRLTDTSDDERFPWNRELAESVLSYRPSFPPGELPAWPGAMAAG